MNLIIELGIMAAFNLGNTPFEKKDFQVPYLMIEKYIYDDFYFKSLNQSRTNAVKINMMNPKTMLWDVELGYKHKIENGLITFGVGHQSEHEVANKDKLTESFDYLKASIRFEY